MSTCTGNDVEITTGSTDETVALGKRLGRLLDAGDVVALSGPLGSGKTYLTKGIALGLGLTDSRTVRSPTFILVSEYQGRVTLYHVDAYRLESGAELASLGSEEFMTSGGVTVIEWAERVRRAVPEEHLWVECRHAGETRRTFRFLAHGQRPADIVKRLSRCM